MTPEDAIAFWETTPLAVVPVRFVERGMANVGFDFAGWDGDTAVLVYRTEEDITKANILSVGGRVAQTKLDADGREEEPIGGSTPPVL